MTLFRCIFRGSTRNLAAAATRDAVFAKLGLQSHNIGCFNGKDWQANGTVLQSYDPSDGELLGTVQAASPADAKATIANMKAAEAAWAKTPAPRRGQVVMDIGAAFRENLLPLSQLLSMEVGKILPEAIGEIQEVIDVVDYAVGLSRSFAGPSLPSERPEHMLVEQWHPLGSVGIITAFNFPVAVWGWNAAISLVVGNVHTWKGAPTTPLLSIAVTKIVNDVLAKHGVDPAVSTMLTGGADVGAVISQSRDVELVSFTGSCEIGRTVASTVASRFGRYLLELGGNNACIVMPDANMDVMLPSIVFGSVGTGGQRCTTLRRLFVHEAVYDTVLEKLLRAHAQLANRIGSPLDEKTLITPLHTASAVQMFEATVKTAQEQGGKLLCGGHSVDRPGNYVVPAVVDFGTDYAADIVLTERFCPVLYVMKFSGGVEEAIRLNNMSEQGLSSAIFTQDLGNIGHWMGPRGSYCGIVNVNTSCSGAEIGGAFGGEKSTGGGRESGTDSWKQYCRRATCTINYGRTVPLAQGLSFE